MEEDEQRQAFRSCSSPACQPASLPACQLAIVPSFHLYQLVIACFHHAILPSWRPCSGSETNSSVVITLLFASALTSLIRCLQISDRECRCWRCRLAPAPRDRRSEPHAPPVWPPKDTEAHASTIRSMQHLTPVTSGMIILGRLQRIRPSAIEHLRETPMDDEMKQHDPMCPPNHFGRISSTSNMPNALWYILLHT